MDGEKDNLAHSVIDIDMHIDRSPGHPATLSTRFRASLVLGHVVLGHVYRSSVWRFRAHYDCESSSRAVKGGRYVWRILLAQVITDKSGSPHRNNCRYTVSILKLSRRHATQT
jgi:hypothetical protein